MASWQPPIPSGALYSKPARALGPALALLAYFYDLVRRDAWIEFSLHDVASDIGEPYPNIKRWWQAIEAGPFFCEVHKRGRKGIRACFKDYWLDWRIIQARDDDKPFGTETGSEMTPNVKKDAGNGIKNGTETGSETIPNDDVYGTHDSDQADHDPPPPKTQPPRVGGGGVADPLLSELHSLFLQLDITNAGRLAARYRAEYPQVTLTQVAAYVETIASDCEKDPAVRGSRYYRKLEHGIPSPRAKPSAAPDRPSAKPLAPGVPVSQLREWRDKYEKEHRP